MKLAIGFADVFYFLKLIIEFRGLIRLSCNFFGVGQDYKGVILSRDIYLIISFCDLAAIDNCCLYQLLHYGLQMVLF